MSKENRRRDLKSTARVEIRPDLQDASLGKDLSYLNEMPQMSRDEGVKAGVPPPRDKSPRSHPESEIEKRKQ
ncbi:MAG TPA: hypothetical protein VEB86_06905 [Chryseosolibacter sp.]|nr:hypothetical protein [Chryseosolibacter sp.]